MSRVRILATRNTDCGGLNWDLVRTAVAEHPEWFLRTDRGEVFYVPWVASEQPQLLWPPPFSAWTHPP